MTWAENDGKMMADDSRHPDSIPIVDFLPNAIWGWV
jgi:hypothetical protein